VTHVPASGHYPTSPPSWWITYDPMAPSPPGPSGEREAWLLGQLVEARRQIDAAADRLRAIEERLEGKGR
jgi:hypothetical protein